MKNYLIILVLIVFAGCAKKTHITDSAEFKTDLKLISDTSTSKNRLVIDKTKMLTTRSVDTNITVTGLALSGYLSTPKLNQDTSAFFENEDLSVTISLNKLGLTRFVAKPKSKQIPVKLIEQTSVYKDIATRESVQTRSKTAISAITTSAQKHIEKQTLPNVNGWLYVVMIALLAIVFIGGISKLKILL